MKTYLTQVYLDEKPTSDKIIKGGQPWTAASKALKQAIESQAKNRRLKTMVVRLIRVQEGRTM